MRKLGKIIFLLCCIFVANKLFDYLLQQINDYNKNIKINTIFQQTESSLIFFQKEKYGLTFSLAEQPLAIRILSNAMINKKDANTDSFWHYTVKYQLVDKEGNIIKQQEYYHRSKILLTKEYATGKTVNRYFLMDKDYLPTSSNEIIIYNTPPYKTHTVRVTISSKDKDIQQVGFRFYTKNIIADKHITYAWNSLSDEEKKEKAKSNIYAPVLLTENEKYQLLKYKWKPIGANGIEGISYLSDKIYLIEGDNIDKTEDDLVSYQIQADLHHHAIYAIPHSGGKITLHIEELELDRNDKERLEVIINWYGKGIDKYQQFKINTLQAKHWEQYLEGGLLEIIVNKATKIQVSININKTLLSLPQQQTLLRAYWLNTDQPLRYHITHYRHYATPMRVDFRYLISMDNIYQTEQKKVHFYFLNKENKIIDQGIIPFYSSLSEYDRLYATATNNSSKEKTYLSQVYRHYFLLPKQVETLLLTSEDKLLVNSYNRPLDFPYTIKVPEDYHLAQQRQDSVPIWFAIKPDHYLALRTKKAYQLFFTQPKPVDKRFNINKNSYTWQDYQPITPSYSRYLFNPKNADIPVKDISLGGIFQSVNINQDSFLYFASLPGQSIISPTLICFKKPLTASKIALLIENKKVLEKTFIGNTIQLDVPTISTGKHRVRVQGDKDIHCYINYTRPDSNTPLYIKRLSYRIEKGNSIVFHYTKNTPQSVLTGLFQMPYGSTSKSRLEVTISPIKRKKSNTDYTLKKRIFVIRANNDSKIKVLNTQQQFVGKGERFYLPLGKDLVAKTYKIKIKLLSGSKGYISLYRFSVGQEEFIRFFTIKDYR